MTYQCIVWCCAYTCDYVIVLGKCRSHTTVFCPFSIYSNAVSRCTMLKWWNFITFLQALNFWKFSQRVDVAQSPIFILQYRLQPSQMPVFLRTPCCTGCQLSKRHFQGTLIRAPLRRRASEISADSFGDAEVKKLVDWIQEDGQSWLLFLRKVATLEVIDVSSNKAWMSSGSWLGV